MKIRLAAPIVAILLVAALAGSAQASGSKPRIGAYDCYTYGYFGLTYLHSAKLKKDGTYLQAFEPTFKNPTKGKWTYKSAKKKIVFKTGAFSTIYGKWHKPDANHTKGSYTEYMKDGSGSPGSCYAH